VGARHHDMALPQVADGGTTFRYGGQMRIYRICSSGLLIMGGLPSSELGGVPQVLAVNNTVIFACRQGASHEMLHLDGFVTEIGDDKDIVWFNLAQNRVAHLRVPRQS